MKNKLIVSILGISMLCSSVSFADEPPTIYPIEKDEPAPWQGVLLSNEAMADMIIKLKVNVQQIELAKQKAREEQKAKGDLEKNNIKTMCDTDKKILQINIDSKQQQVNELLKALDKTKSNNVIYYVLGSVAVAGIVFGATALAVR